MPSKLPRYNICLDAEDRHMLDELSNQSHVPASTIVRTLIRAMFNHASGRDSLCADCSACLRPAAEQNERRKSANRRWKANKKDNEAPRAREKRVREEIE